MDKGMTSQKAALMTKSTTQGSRASTRMRRVVTATIAGSGQGRARVETAIYIFFSFSVIGCGFLSANCHPPIECGDAAHARGRRQFGCAGGDGCHVADCRRRRRCGRMRRGILRRGSKRLDWNGSLPCPVFIACFGIR